MDANRPESKFPFTRWRALTGVIYSYYAPRYVVAKPGNYRLLRAYGYLRWVRHGRDFLLVDIRNGTVRRVIYG